MQKRAARFCGRKGRQIFNIIIMFARKISSFSPASLDKICAIRIFTNFAAPETILATTLRMFGIFKKRAGFADLDFKADWHCHLLAGVDDGVKDIADSVTILRDMKAAGVNKVTHTPHMNPQQFPDNTEAYIKDRFAAYLEQIPQDLKDGMDLRLAGEYMVYNGFEERDPKELLQITDGKVLIEMSYYFISPTMEQAIFNLNMAGITPVIAHPERYIYLAGSLGTFDRYHEMGAEFQLNLMSLSGVYGAGSMTILEHLLKKGYYSYMGTDTHTVNHFRNICKMEYPTKLLELKRKSSF